MATALSRHDEIMRAVITARGGYVFGDYFGPTLNLGARIMSAGHSGQVLVGATTKALAAPSKHVLIDLGEHSLRDIDAAQRVFHVVGEAMRTDFPPIRSMNRTKHRLPSMENMRSPVHTVRCTHLES